MREVFDNIIYKHSFRTIRSIYQLSDKQEGIWDYNQPSLRNYIWKSSKATNFIETILLYGDVPHMVVYKKNKNSKLEIIDGKQRFLAIVNFLNNKFRLRRQGLKKLWRLSGKTFSQLEDELKERILNTALRFAIIEVKDEKSMTPEAETFLRQQLVKRFNMSITPLKKEEVTKAEYLQNKINSYFLQQFHQSPQLYDIIKDTFHHRSKNIETMMQHIRQLLVLHNIPISRYATERDDIINKYYDFLSYQTMNEGTEEDIRYIFENFKRKLLIVQQIKNKLGEHRSISGNLAFECIYWAISICEQENVDFNQINNSNFIDRLIDHITKRQENYVYQRSNFAQFSKKRYELMATFFCSQLTINFSPYLQSDKEFILKHKEKINRYLREEVQELEQEPLTRSMPTQLAVVELLDKMKRQKFLIRPPYQRKESMSISNASLLIESILLGIKFYPIYVYKTKGDFYEVIDGQQRLLTIIGFLGEKYKNENGIMDFSQKNNFSLQLESSLLSEFHLNKFEDLPISMQKCILNFEIDIVEITEGEYKSFKPEDLFTRFNYKPSPIKKDTFEFWNACMDYDIINAIKDVYKRNSWLYLRKADPRMKSEELITCLCYLDYMCSSTIPSLPDIKEVLSISAFRSSIIVKLRNKAHITDVLQDPSFKESFLLSLNSFETKFLEKIKILTANPSGRTTDNFRTKQLDNMLHINPTRFSANFFVLWMILKGIPDKFVSEARSTVRSNISKIFAILKTGTSVERFEIEIVNIWNIVD